jgi:hypothetical protein
MVSKRKRKEGEARQKEIVKRNIKSSIFLLIIKKKVLSLSLSLSLYNL